MQKREKTENINMRNETYFVFKTEKTFFMLEKIEINARLKKRKSYTS